MSSDIWATVTWRKSTRSGGNGNCVEVAVAPVWRSSSRSGGNGNCVEVAPLDQVVGIRDSKDPHGPVLAVGPTEWRALIAGLRNREFELA